jgi:hypothetical protein
MSIIDPSANIPLVGKSLPKPMMVELGTDENGVSISAPLVAVQAINDGVVAIIAAAVIAQLELRGVIPKYEGDPTQNNP